MSTNPGARCGGVGGIQGCRNLGRGPAGGGGRGFAQDGAGPGGGGGCDFEIENEFVHACIS
jgi:hypothetical protein